MAKKKGRDCTECIAYCNMLGGEGYRCGLGFEVVEDVEGGFGMWIAVVHPYENSCSSIELPTTKEEFVQTAAKLGIEWDIDEVADFDDIYQSFIIISDNRWAHTTAEHMKSVCRILKQFIIYSYSE